MTDFSRRIEQVVSEVQSRFQVPDLSIAVIGKDLIEYMKDVWNPVNKSSRTC